MKKGGAKIGRKELSPQAHFSWMSERFRNGLPLKAPWLAEVGEEEVQGSNWECSFVHKNKRNCYFSSSAEMGHV